MKYYIYFYEGQRFPTEITGKRFHSLKRRKNAHITMCTSPNDGSIESYTLRFYQPNINYRTNEIHNKRPNKINKSNN